MVVERSPARPDIEIRAISADDAYPLRRRHLRPTLPPEDSRYARDDHPAAFHLGAFAHGDLVGAVSFLPGTERGEVDTRIYQLQAMVTVPSVRNAGVGARLGQAGITLLEARGATRVWCDGRSPAASLYERLGFRTVGEEFVTATGSHFRFVMDLNPASG